MIIALRSYNNLVTWGDIAALLTTILLGVVICFGCAAMAA